jgi:hypothetical protein
MLKDKAYDVHRPAICNRSPQQVPTVMLLLVHSRAAQQVITT